MRSVARSVNSILLCASCTNTLSSWSEVDSLSSVSKSVRTPFVLKLNSPVLPEMM